MRAILLGGKASPISLLPAEAPATERDLGGGLPLQQWVVDGYLLARVAMILPGGSISDLFGRVPVLRFGLTAFGTGSVLAATAASAGTLTDASFERLLQRLSRGPTRGAQPYLTIALAQRDAKTRLSAPSSHELT